MVRVNILPRQSHGWATADGLRPGVKNPKLQTLDLESFECMLWESYTAPTGTKRQMNCATVYDSESSEAAAIL